MSIRLRTFATLLATLALLGVAHAAPALLRKTPYLAYPGDPARMTVRWQLSARDSSTVLWGSDTTFALGRIASGEYGDDHQHAATLTGLVPGRRYVYRVITRGAAFDGAFTAAPDPATSRVELFVYGDTRSDPAAHDRVAAAMLEACARDSALRTLALFVGDLASSGNDEQRWTDEFFGPGLPHLRALMAQVPYAICRGNHDGGTPMLLDKYFPSAWGADRFGSFDYGPLHVAIVDQYVPYGPDSRQFAWLSDDLARTQRPWKLLLVHEPGWAANGGHPNNELVQMYLHPLCRQWGVPLVINGHDHYYARADVDGIAYVTTGGGGAPLYVPELPAEHVVVAHRAYHYCTIAIDGDRLVLRAKSPAGATLDSLVITR